ncbi:MAG TPA: redoxin domain-containing protein [Thermoanaerobaculia bacterium]|nr:redoxin domain-containing protein [Thermoanaerobaculia bacterium]
MGFGFYGTYAALWAIVLFQGLLILALLRQIVNLRQAVEKGGGLGLDLLPAGAEAPAFWARDLRAGQPLTAEGLRGEAAVLLFVTADCALCKTVLDGLRRRELGQSAQVVVVCIAAETDCAPLLNRVAPDLTVLADPSEDIRRAYRVSATPTAVILDEGGRIRGYAYPRDAGELEDKLANVLGNRSGRRGVAASL